MFDRKSRWLCVTASLVALAFSGWAVAQQPPPADKPEQKPQQPPAEASKDIVQTAMDAKLDTFCDLLKAAGLVETLKGPGPFTVFVPSDAAFAKLGPELDDLKKPENKQKLADILKGHVVSGKEMAAAIEKMNEIKPLHGDAIKVAMKDGKVVLNDKATVTKADLAACNGVIHVIDAVLMPAAPKAPAPAPMEKKPEEKKPEAKPAEQKPG